MLCEQAEQLFDAYLDGELSDALATELGAHRLKCPNCRRALALLEVTGHIIGSDKEPAGLSELFSDRLLACVDDQKSQRTVKLRRALYIAGPVAAAALIVLAFAGFFDGRGVAKVAGVKEIKTQSDAGDSLAPGKRDAASYTKEGADLALSRWIEQTRRNVDAKRRSGETLRHALDATLRETLDFLEEGEGFDAHAPGSDLPPSDAPAESFDDENAPDETDDGGDR